MASFVSLAALVVHAFGVAQTTHPPLEEPTVALGSRGTQHDASTGSLFVLAHTLAAATSYGDGVLWSAGTAVVNGWQSALGTTRHETKVSSVFASAHLPFFSRPRSGLRVGLELAVSPTQATDPGEGRVGRVAAAEALAVHGAWNAWRWIPGRTGFALPVLFAWRHPGPDEWAGEARGEAAVGRAFSLRDFTGEKFSDFVQLGAQYRFRPLSMLLLGLRSQLVWMMDAPFDRLQLSVEPSVEVRLGAFSMGLKYLLNLDEPYGFGAHGRRSAALGVHLGWWR